MKSEISPIHASTLDGRSVSLHSVGQYIDIVELDEGPPERKIEVDSSQKRPKI